MFRQCLLFQLSTAPLLKTAQIPLTGALERDILITPLLGAYFFAESWEVPGSADKPRPPAIAGRREGGKGLPFQSKHIHRPPPL